MFSHLKNDRFDRAGITEQIVAIPKADLHLHAEAGPRLDQLLAARGERSAYDWNHWAKHAMVNLGPGMPRLLDMAKELISPEQDAEPEYFRARVEMALAEAASSGALYAEVRFGRETVARKDFMTLFREAEQNVQKRFPHFMAEPLATLIPQQDPERTVRLAEACLEAAGNGLRGVDLIPDPYHTEADWTMVYPLAERFASAGLGITIHAAEFSTANLSAALDCPGVRRIGHGIQAAGDPHLTGKLVSSGVALECCITSNVILGAVRSIVRHPVKRLLDAGVPVTVNTDNPVRFRTDLAQEYSRAVESGMTVAELGQATRTAIEYSFTTPLRRDRLRERFRTLVPTGSDAPAAGQP